MPALNAAGIIENCLRSIRRQDYPQDRIEILVGDAGSKDGTKDLVLKHGGQVFPDHGRNIEDGKKAALIHATGEYIVFIDADNEITHPDYIRLAVNALAHNPSAFGVESYYLPSPKMSSFCAYLTHLLHISDPVAWMMSIKPVFLGANDEVERWTFPKGSMAYPVGSNGFVFRASELDGVRAREEYSDTHTSVRLIQATGKREWLRIRGRGVHHYYVQTLREFVKKRQRATCHFLDMQKQYGFSWTERKPRVPGWFACAWCASFFLPCAQMLVGLVRSGDLRWLWHPWASWASAYGVLSGWWIYKRRGGDRKLIHSLQPRQVLKS
ncbi:MAG: glycosyltransferase family 2 protein [Verrucomicrobia subdivision 3 bacterium]|nr:glycosyltransferase family 2 protein [Limisphaerales bacterium]